MIVVTKAELAQSYMAQARVSLRSRPSAQSQERLRERGEGLAMPLTEIRCGYASRAGWESAQPSSVHNVFGTAC